MKLMHLRLAIIAALTVSQIVAAPADTSAPTHLSLTVLHTNDVHGHFLPFWYRETGRGDTVEAIRGGVARRSTLIHQIRATATHPVILVDSGDIFTRGPFATTFEGVPDVLAMNATGYEIAEVGNNEFKAKDGVDQDDAVGSQAALLKLVKLSKFPWICANLQDANGAPIDGIKPYVVRDFAGVKVGFLGLTTPRSASYPQTKGWTILDPIDTAKKWVPIVRKECDIVIALTHDGVDSDVQLAGATSGIDAIVGGDSHTFLYAPKEIKNIDGVTVPIVQDGEFGVDLGQFDLEFSKRPTGAWRLDKYADKLIPVGKDVADDRSVVQAVLPYTDKLLHTIVGRLPDYSPDMTPAQRSHTTTMYIMNSLRLASHAAVAMNPEGYGFFDVFREKSVRDYDIRRVMPFHNVLVIAMLPGSKIKDMASRSIVSGDLALLADDANYPVAMIDFTATTYYKLEPSALKYSGSDVRDIFHRYIATQDPQAVK